MLRYSSRKVEGERLCTHLQLVANVDDKGIGLGADSEPLTVFEDLEACDVLVLKEDRESVGIGMGRESVGELWLGTGRVIIDSHVLPLFPQHLPNVVLVKAQALRYELLNCIPKFPHLHAILTHNFPVRFNIPGPYFI